MKQSILLAFALLIFTITFAQSPEKISYQSIVRDTAGKVIVNQLVAMKISLLKKTINGTVVYSEIHRPKANANGLVTLQIGDGDVVFGDFSNINWGDGPFYLKTQVDPSGDSTKTTYTISGTTQLLSVPYALYANSASLRVSEIGDTLFSGKNYVLIPGISKANEVTSDSNRPVVVTDSAFNITASSVSLTASVTDSGASAVTARGICYGTSSSPNLGNIVVESGVGIGSFSATLSALEPSTRYYARAYASNATGVSYGNEITFRTDSINLQNGLVAYYPFTGNANDSSGNGFNAVVHNAVLTTDRFGKTAGSYSFQNNSSINASINYSSANKYIIVNDSTNYKAYLNKTQAEKDSIFLAYLADFVNTGGNPTGTWTPSIVSDTTYVNDSLGVYSFSAWINAVGSNESIILQYKDGLDTSVNNNFDIFLSHSGCSPLKIAAQHYPDYNPSACSPDNIDLNKWEHIYVQFIKNSHFLVYKNGIVWFEGPIGTKFPDKGIFTIGNNINQAFPFNGKIDDVRFYSRALTQSEITYLATH